MSMLSILAQATTTLSSAALGHVPATPGRGDGPVTRYFFGAAANSVQGQHTDWVYLYIFWLSTFAFVVLMVLMVYFAIKYRRSKQAENYQVSAAHNTPLELAWSIIPLLTMVPMFYFGFTGYVEKVAAPKSAEEITIRGLMWSWEAVYRNGASPQDAKPHTKVGIDVPIIIVPEGRPVKLLMTSADVIHSFYVPDFRMKFDVFPNRYTSMWFQPLGLGEHEVFCAEYCGDKHSEMAAWIKVVPREEYEKTIHDWGTKLPPGNWGQVGAKVARRKGCIGCHSADGSKNTGPTWLNLYGATNKYTDGSQKTVDENWLRENILYSQRHIVEGYPTSMPVYAGQLKDEELFAIVQYIKSLSDKTSAAERSTAELMPVFDEATNAPILPGPNTTTPAPPSAPGDVQPAGVGQPSGAGNEPGREGRR